MSIEIVKKALQIAKANLKQEEIIPLRIIKKDKEQRLFFAVVLEPMTDVTPEGDAHGDVMTMEEIQKSAHSFLLNGGIIFKQHKDKVNDVSVIESYISPVDYTPEGSSEKIKKGSWVAGVKVINDELWEEIEKGEITAFSPGGIGYRKKKV